ncbi:MAG: GNAT family N-acetyltransferase, partial [Byssovorax sp.]
MTILVRPTTLAEDGQLLRPLAVAFGFDVSPERLERLQAIPELVLPLGAFDGDELVGSAGSWTF